MRDVRTTAAEPAQAGDGPDLTGSERKGSSARRSRDLCPGCHPMWSLTLRRTSRPPHERRNPCTHSSTTVPASPTGSRSPIRRSSTTPMPSWASTPSRSAAPTCTSSRATCPRSRPGRVLGHEAVGTVEEVGAGVRDVRPGDRVLVSCIAGCGTCRFCREGRYGQCLGGGGWALGHTINGVQAEYARVPVRRPVHARAADRRRRRRGRARSPTSCPPATRWGCSAAGSAPATRWSIVGAGPIGLAGRAHRQAVLPLADHRGRPCRVAARGRQAARCRRRARQRRGRRSKRS